MNTLRIYLYLLILFTIIIQMSFSDIKPEIKIQYKDYRWIDKQKLTEDKNNLIISNLSDIIIIDRKTFKEIRRIRAIDKNYIKSFTTIDNMIYAVFEDGYIGVWNFLNGKLVRYEKILDTLEDIIYCNEIKQIVVRGNNNDDNITNSLWYLTLDLHILENPNVSAQLVGMSDNCDYALYHRWYDFEKDKEVNLFEVYDLNKKEIVYYIDNDKENNFSECKFSRDGKYILLYDIFSDISFIYDFSNNKKIKLNNNNCKDIYSADFSYDNKFLLTGHSSDKIVLWDVESGKTFKIIQKEKSDSYYEILSIFFPDETYTAYCSSYLYFSIYDILSGELIVSYETERSNVFDTIYNKKNQEILIGAENGIQVWDFNTLKKKDFIKMDNNCVKIITTSDYKYFCSFEIINGTTYSDNVHDKTEIYRVKIFDTNSYKIIYHTEINCETIAGCLISDDGNRIYIASRFIEESTTKYKIYTIDKLKNNIEMINQGIGDVTNLYFTKEENEIIFNSGNKVGIAEFTKINLLDNTLKKIEIKIKGIDSCFAINKEKNILILGQSGIASFDKPYINDYTYKIISLDDISVVKSYSEDKQGGVDNIILSEDGSYFMISDSDNNILRVDADSGKQVYNFIYDRSDKVRELEIIDSIYFFYRTTEELEIVNTKNNDRIVIIQSRDQSKWLTSTDDGFWDGSTNCGELVSMVDGLDCWNIDQFAIKNNRPDKILEKLPNADPELIKHYYSQYQKRLKKLGLTEEDLGDDYHVPEVKIIRDEQKEKFFDLEIELTDSLYKLKSYNIFINDVPIFGAYGKAITGNKGFPSTSLGTGKPLAIREIVELKEGENKIEISCLNEKGAESYRALTYANYTIKEETKHDLYFIGFGVSQYDDPDIKDLNFAHKDVLDLSEVYKGMTERYNNIYTHTFINDQVTPESINKAKDLLKNAKVDDTFVLFISGHGVHDTDPEATYYFLTSNTNLDNLAETAANFELIENLMQGIAPRNKLFLMDTCESGEIDEEQQDIYFAAADSKGITARNVEKRDSKGKTLLKKRAPRPWLFEKDRYIYNDLLRRSGAIVFSSCRGGEFSYESNDIGNGYFTESIIKALSDKDGDKNSDGIVDTDELRNYVTDSVKALSGDLQHPTIDRDNIYAKFGF